MDHFGPENGTSPNSRSALGISFKFCTVKEDNRYIEIPLMALPKKQLDLGKWTIQDTKWCILTTLDSP